MSSIVDPLFPRVLFRLHLLILLTTIATAQSPVDFSSPTVQSGLFINSFTMADVTGSPHPDVVYQTVGSGVSISDRHTAGPPTITNLGGTSGNIRSWAVGDVNQDGQNDIVTLSAGATAGSSAVQIFVSTTGGYSLTTIADSSVTGMTVHLVDMDADGAVDLVYGTRVRLNVAGSFPADAAIPVTTAPVDVQPGDYDGDGDFDLAYLSIASGTLTVQCVRNDGGQVFTPRTPTNLSGDFFVAKVAEMNGDGRDDLVLVSSAANRVRCRSLLGTMQATFSAQPNFEIYGNVMSRRELGLGDLDGDGAVDAVVTFLKPDATTATVILMNTGAGQFAAGTGIGLSSSFGIGISRFNLTDEDLDGDIDVVGGSANGLPPINTLLTAFNVPPSPAGPTTIVPSAPMSPGVVVLGSTFLAGYQLTLANGPLARSRIATIGFTSANGSTPNPINVVTDSIGRLQFEIDFGSTPGIVAWTISTTDGGNYSQFVSSSPTLTLVSGDGQSYCTNANLAKPLVVRATDTMGSPIAGIPISFSIGNFMTLVRFTDAFGNASLDALPPILVSNGQVTVTAGAPGSVPVVFHVTILQSTVASISGSDQVTRPGEAFPNPLTMVVSQCDGPPLPGVTVGFVTSNSLVTLSPSTVVTDASGFASVTAFAQPSAQGSYFVVAYANGVQIATFNLFVRRLRSTSFPTSVLLSYFHEHANVPLLLAADLPLPAPGSIPTPFGDVHTSILNPGPSLSVIDGLGVFGPIAPQMMTGLNGWSRNVALPPSPLGLTFVVQIYGYDPAYPGLDAYFISNPINVSI